MGTSRFSRAEMPKNKGSCAPLKEYTRYRDTTANQFTGNANAKVGQPRAGYQ
jgi:hypothetical protein